MNNCTKEICKMIVKQSRHIGVVLLLVLFGIMQSAPIKAQDFLVMGWSGMSGSNKLILNGTTTVNILQSGWYLQTGSHSVANTNYICGYYTSQYYRNFFAFNIPSGLGAITSAVLQVQQYGSI